MIGAGPAGLTAAYRLQQLGADVAIFEATEYVGGLARSFDLWGHRVDLGPHRFFSSDERVNDLWREVIGSDSRAVERQTRIYYRKRYFDYPLKIGNVLKNLSVADIAASLASYSKELFLPEFPANKRDTFEAWIVSQFGRRLFEMFFKIYSEKLWGIPCTELDADFAAQRIRRFSLGQSILAALGLGKEKHKTLVDLFSYPKAGSGELYRRIAKAVTDNGGKIYMRSPVRRIIADYVKVSGLELQDGSTYELDHVVSTMPLTTMLQGLGKLPDDVADCVRRLRFRNTILIYLNIDAPNLFPDQWLYIHSDDVMVGRITNFRNWVPELYGELTTTILALEYWCYDHDSIWNESNLQLIDRAKSECQEIGLLGSARILSGHVERVRRSYPVYFRGYRDNLAPIVAYLKKFNNLWPIGRYGSFKYNNQDHSILMGLLVADNICNGAAHDLWSVNSDYDNYQEAAPVTV